MQMFKVKKIQKNSDVSSSYAIILVPTPLQKGKMRVE
jgi:hypothetical protein